jgi:hypothetical protein
MSTLSEDQVIKAIKVHIAKGDQAKERADQAGKKAEEHYKAAGIHLKALRDGSPSKAAWEELIKSKCGIGASRAYDLIAIADGRKTVADVRLGTAKRMRSLRSRPSRDGQNKAEPASAIDICYYCSKKREVRLAATEPFPKYACDECFERGAGSFSSNLPAKVEPTAAEPEPTPPANPLVEAWDKASPKQRHDFVLARKVEIMKAQQQIGWFAHGDVPLGARAAAAADNYPDMSDSLRRTPEAA